jgi:DNA-binding SARP family transcriptional activator/Tfp pilus assembly protein PilF
MNRLYHCAINQDGDGSGHFGPWVASGPEMAGSGSQRDGQAPGEILEAGLHARRQGNYAAAQELLESALEAGRQAGQEALSARAAAELGVLASLQGDTRAASLLYRRALSQQRRVGDESGAAATLERMGQLALLQGDAGGATGLVEEAVAIWRRLGDQRGLARGLRRLGQLALSRSDYTEARLLITEAIELGGAMGSERELADGLANLGFLEYTAGNNDASEVHFRKALDIGRAAGDRRRAAVAMVGLANALFLRSGTPADPAGALDLAAQAGEELNHLGAKRDEAWAVYVAGEIQRSRGELFSAEQYARRSLELYAEAKDPMVGLPYYTLGQLALVRSDLTAARVFLGHALREARLMGGGLQMARALEAMAALARRQGAAGTAARLLGAAEAWRDRLGLVRTPVQNQAVTSDLYAITSTLGVEAAEQARADGRRLTLEAAVHLGLREVGEPAPVELIGGAGEPTFSVRVLGDFAVARHGATLRGGGGQVGSLIKVLAVRGALHTEELIDLLWPGAQLDVARRRLNNVLARARREFGPLVERQGEMVQLASKTDLDLTRFHQAAARCLAETGPDTGPELVTLGAAALAAYGGELLPADRFEDWTVPAREEVRATVLRLLDRLGDRAEARGDVDEALGWLRQATQVEPADESRLLRLARLAQRSGRRSQALAAMAQARHQAQVMAVPLSPEWKELRAELKA